mgnify:CR=1 FL=1
MEKKNSQKKEIKVENYLKIPDGTEKLEKTTSGTISFSADGEIVKAFANPEPDGLMFLFLSIMHGWYGIL